MAVEEAKYDIERDYGAFEVRTYAPVVVAETSVSGDFNAGSNEGFRRLAGYIFGGNTTRQKIAMAAPVGAEPSRADSARIAMTAPVGQTRKGDAWVMTFTMPASESLQTLPTPKDSSVRLREVPGRRVAAVKFSGRWGVGRFEEKAAELVRALDANGLKATEAPPIYARYNPPWTLWFLRRNEVLIPLAS
jgi:hypothetical protein